jgi:hypothetical protein
MPATTKMSNYFKEMLICGQIDFGRLGTDEGTPNTFKLILMNNSFTFNEGTHAFLSDVISSALPSENGYTGAVTLNPLTIARSEVTDIISASWDNIHWDITGDGIRTNGAIVYDDTPDPYDERIIVGYFDFGGEKVTYNDGVFTLTNGKFNLY